MTVTATPSRPAPAAADHGGGSSGARRAERPSPRSTLRVPAEVALCLVTAAAALSFNRLFVDSSFLPPVLATLALSHLLAVVLRRRRVPVALAGAVSVVLMVIVCTWVFYWFTTRAGLPTRLTWDTFTEDLREAVQRFREDQAPVEAVRGFVAGSAIGFWLVAFLGDWSAFRLWAPVEATIPAGSLFVFASLLGADRSRTVFTAVFFLAAVGFLLLHRVARVEMSPSWVRGDGRRGARAQLVTGGGIIVVALVAVGVVGPLLPGASSEALLDVKDIGNDNGTRITVSPLVDIKQRLVNQSETEVFRVTSPVHSYWRLTALDEFDGRVWRSSKRFEKVTGELPGGTARASGISGTSQVVQQTFTVSKLAQIWLPAAFEAHSVRGVERDVRWEPSTSTLIVNEETSDGMQYEVTSEVTDHSAEVLRLHGGTAPGAIEQEFLALPSNLPDSVRDLAEALTADARTDYDRAMALQAYFRTNYTYDINAPGGQDIDAIEDFVFNARAGYCEQFAGTFAAMARSVGLPTRVAVGFTLGDPDPDAPDTYIVKGRHAHAWPEVYLDGAGWILFEPTPGRGSPNATYTGLTESQDSDIAPNGSTTTSTAPSPSLGAEFAPPIEEFGGGLASEGLAEEGGGTTTQGERPVDRTGARVVLVLFALVVLYLLGVPLAHVARRHVRRRRAGTTTARIDVAWRDATDALGLLGVRPAVGETPAEFAARADRRSRAGTQVQELAGITTAARYAPDVPGERDGRRAVVLADGITRAVRDQTTGGERMREVLDPRPLLRRWNTVLLHANRADGDTEDAHSRLVVAHAADADERPAKRRVGAGRT